MTTNKEDNHCKIVFEDGKSFTIARAYRQFPVGYFGNWQLQWPCSIGVAIADEDRYRNDLIERLTGYVKGERSYADGGWKLGKSCTPEEYMRHAKEWTDKLTAEYGGQWTGDYREDLEEARFYQTTTV
jgi:hypothetical protein